MKNVDYVIVGDGFAAYFFAHQLLKNDKTFILFSSNKAGASKVSAGIVNPLVLKKFTTFWLAAEQIEFLKNTLAEIEMYTGSNYLISENIHRIFYDNSERELWISKTETPELKPFLNTEFKKLKHIQNPFATGKVNHSARVDVANFFQDFAKILDGKNALIFEEFHYKKLAGSSYGDLSFKHLVFCEGMGVRKNPYFKDLQVIPNKGHHLKVRLNQTLEDGLTLKKKHFLFPLGNDEYYYGGTYDPNERENVVDDFKREELETGLREFYPHSYETIEINYGFRPTVKDRRPILGRHTQHSNYYIFNGLGARGILNGCYFSKHLFEYIEYGKELMPEVDLKRFS